MPNGNVECRVVPDIKFARISGIIRFFTNCQVMNVEYHG